MAVLLYLDEGSIHSILEELTYKLYPGTPTFKLLGTDGRHRLLSALSVPRQPNHRHLQHKAGALHWHLNQGHPYADGNKRLAVTTMETFLSLNGASLIASDDEVKEMALGVARGDLSRAACCEFIRTRCVRRDWNGHQIDRWANRLPGEQVMSVKAAADEYGPFGRSDRVLGALVKIVGK